MTTTFGYDGAMQLTSALAEDGTEDIVEHERYGYDKASLGIQPASSKTIRFPSARAALSSVLILSASLSGSSRRSSADREVSIASAILVLVRSWRSISAAICHAIARLRASAVTAPRRPSCSRKSSKLEPMCGLATRRFLAGRSLAATLRFATFDFLATTLHLLLTLARSFELSNGRLLRLLDEAMEQHHLAIVNAEENPCDSVGKIGPHFKKPLPERSAGRHADGPSELDGHDVYPYRLAVCARLLQQPVAHRLGAGPVPVESGGKSLLDRHRASPMYQ